MAILPMAWVMNLGKRLYRSPHVDEVVLFEEFFTAGLGMPPHPVLAAILLKYQI
jgi:hypothetical protein